MLSAKSRSVLDLIAQGFTYDRILATNPGLTYYDIFNAAKEALELASSIGSIHAERVTRVHKNHPRAYEKWTEEEDAQLAGLVRAGHSVVEVAALHQRQPSAIRSRITKLGLTVNNRGGLGGFDDEDLRDVPF